MKGVIIQASSRSDGQTASKVQQLQELSNWDILDLRKYNFSYFDYEHANQDDDFIPLMQKIITEYDLFIFATPVYWYSMSGLMKVFWDRVTDLITIEKDWGRKLRGKSMAVLSCSNGNNLGDHFWLPFIHSADYLGMHYLANVHTYQDKDDMKAITAFYKGITSAQKLD